MSGQVANAAKDVHPSDIIIAFVGPAGCGKSFFIDLLTGRSDKRARSSLAAVTREIEATRIPLPEDPKGRQVVLVDTPGFDDTTRSDLQILYMISDWLTKTYEEGVKLCGLVYLHRITDNRMAGSPYKNLRMFGELCGNVTMSQVVLVSTMWGRVNYRVGCAREQELKKIFWKDLINKGSDVDRLQEATTDAAWLVVSKVIRRRLERQETPEAVLLQEELVDNGITLNETQAGKTLYANLQKQLAGQKESMGSLLAQVEKSDDPQLIKELRREYERIQREFDRTFEEAKQLKVSLFKKIFLFLFAKRTRSKAVKVARGS